MRVPAPAQVLRFMVAGVAGGIAEVLWIGLYGSLHGPSGAIIAREVAATVLPQARGQALAPLLGLMIHFGLSAAAGIAIGLTMLRGRRSAYASDLAVLAATLTLVWAANFLVLLPTLNATLAHLLPYSVTLVSKVLFAVGMASALHCANWRASRPASTSPV